MVVGVLAALLGGAVVQWLRARDPLPAPPASVPAKSGWAKPPYVFEARRDLDAAAAEAKKAGPEALPEKN